MSVHYNDDFKRKVVRAYMAGNAALKPDALMIIHQWKRALHRYLSNKVLQKSLISTENPVLGLISPKELSD